LAERPGQKTLLGEWQNQQVVVKTLNFSEMPTWKNLELFEREAQTLKNLEHPALPRFLDWGQGENGIYLITAYIPGQTLAEKLGDGWRPSEQEIRELAEQLLQILIFLHGHHPPLIHRDIKPKNLVLNQEGQLFLIDFGAVSQLLTPEGSSTVAGTFGYMAPEQFAGKAVPTSDLYGLAATLVHLLTGRVPSELPQKRLRLDFEPYAHCSPALITWLHSLLDPLPEDRCPSAEKALETLKQIENRPVPVNSKVPERAFLRPPLESQLQVRQESDFLQIQIPAHPHSDELKKKERHQLILLGARFSAISIIFLVTIPNPVLFASLFSPLLFLLLGSFYYEKNKFKHLLQMETELKLTAESIFISQTPPQKPRETFEIPWNRLARIEEKRKSWNLENRGEQIELQLIEHQPTLSGQSISSGKYRVYRFGHALNDQDRAYLFRLLQAQFRQALEEKKDTLIKHTDHKLSAAQSFQPVHTENVLSLPNQSALHITEQEEQTEIIVPPQDLNTKQKQKHVLRQSIQALGLGASYLSLLVALMRMHALTSDWVALLFLLTYLPSIAWYLFAERQALLRLTRSRKHLKMTADSLFIETYSPLDAPKQEHLPLSEIKTIRLRNDPWSANFETQKDGVLIQAKDQKKYSLGETLSKTDQAWLVARLQAHIEQRSLPTEPD